jgi:hypothetical protein
MSEVPTASNQAAGHYEIRVKGHLAARWSARFDDMLLTRHDDGTTVIKGTVADQTALHGLLRKVSDLGVQLISVTRSTPEPAVTHTQPDPPQPNHLTRRSKP